MIARGRGERLLALLLYLYPPAFRHRFGPEMRQFLREDRSHEPTWRLCLGLIVDAAIEATGEWVHVARDRWTRRSTVDPQDKPGGLSIAAWVDPIRRAGRRLNRSRPLAMFIVGLLACGLGADLAVS